MNGASPAAVTTTPYGVSNDPGRMDLGGFNYRAMAAHFASGLSLEHFSHLSVGSAEQRALSAAVDHHSSGGQFDLSSAVEDSVLATAASLATQMSPQEPTYVNL